MKNILEHLKKWAELAPNKLAITDGETEITYGSLWQQSRDLGAEILKREVPGKSGIAVIMNRGSKSLVAMLGAVCAGSFYIVIDPEMPEDRIETIFQKLTPALIVSDEDNLEKANNLTCKGGVLEFQKAISGPDADMDEVLDKVMERSTDRDPVYALFTSGSSGIPKGTIITHRNIFAYSEWVAKTFDINEDTVFGNQTPFYFSMSVLDIYTTLRCGATLVVLAKALFAFPMTLVEFLNNHKVNTIYWVPSALGIVANSKVLDYAELPLIEKVLFAGEIMPTRYLNHWISHKPDVLYANLYGPTETTDICAYYVVNREFADDEPIPIGVHCDNCEIILLKEDDTEALEGEAGEICVRGTIVAQGYYNEPEKTKEAFVQNPLNPYYPETIYRTGDLAKYNEYGELMYLTRKDFQIKHMGYRIELGEIETAAGSADWIKSCCCVFDAARDKIIMIYDGKKRPAKDLRDIISAKVPHYMVPNEIRRIKSMPINQNGKMDRKWLTENYEEAVLCE